MGKYTFASIRNIYLLIKIFFSEQRVKICLQNAEEKDANIIGIDEYGFLKVKLVDGTVETVQPDGNSFDMLKGLIVPKYY